MKRARDWLKKQWARLLRETSMTEPGTATALVRIGTALSMLVLFVPFVFTEAGRDVVRFAFCDEAYGGYRVLKEGTRGIGYFGGPSEAVIQGLLMTSIVCAVLMLFGVLGRAPVLVAAIVTKMVFAQNSDVSGGADSLLGNILFLLLLADCTATLSVDAKLRCGRFVDHTPIAAWPRKLMLIELALVYTTTGWQKLVSSAWTTLDGFSALYQILQSPQWAKAPAIITDADGWLVVPAAIASLITIVWECTFFVVLVKPTLRVRVIYAVTGVAMHIGIITLMQVGIFSLLAMSLYPAMFATYISRMSTRET